MSKFSKWIMLVLISTTFGFSLAACKEEGAAERLGREVDEAAENAREAADDATE